MNESAPTKRIALVTGITGQDGSYLTELLLGKGYAVVGLVRRTSAPNTSRIGHLLDRADLRLIHGDLSDAASLRQALADAKPDEVYNLAAQSHVKVSFDLPEYTGDVTGLGATRLLAAIRELGLPCRFFQASSSEVFGAAVESPQNETTRFWPRSPYAAAKAYAFDMTRNYREAYGLFASNGIMFNHESPRRGESFVTRKISLAAAAIKLGRQERVDLGNLDAKRDWGFAGDFADAMWRTLQASRPDDFVIATGQTHSVRDFCNACFAEIGLALTWRGEGVDETGVDSNGVVRVAVDPQYFRPSDVEALCGDSSRARRELGWSPTVSFEGLARMMVQADLRLVESRAAQSPTEAPIS